VARASSPSCARRAGSSSSATVHERRLMWPDQVPALLAAVERALAVRPRSAG